MRPCISDTGCSLFRHDIVHCTCMYGIFAVPTQCANLLTDVSHDAERSRTRHDRRLLHLEPHQLLATDGRRAQVRLSLLTRESKLVSRFIFLVLKPYPIICRRKAQRTLVHFKQDRSRRVRPTPCSQSFRPSTRLPPSTVLAPRCRPPPVAARSNPPQLPPVPTDPQAASSKVSALQVVPETVQPLMTSSRARNST